MSCVIIASQNLAFCREIGERVAERLGYTCIGDGILAEAAGTYGISEEKLAQAIGDQLTFFGMGIGERKKQITYLQAALAGQLARGNVVYVGPLGHLLIQGISHVLKVHLIVPRENLIRYEMEVSGVSRAKAEKLQARRVQGQMKWIKQVFGVDADDRKLFDREIDLGELGAEEAVRLIVEQAGSPHYRPMTYSEQLMADKKAEYDVRARLVELDPEVRVECRGGKAEVFTRATGKSKAGRPDEIKRLVLELDSVTEVTVHVSEDMFGRMAGKDR